MMKLVIDCDAGLDDAQAIMMVLGNKDVDLLGLTTVCGNTDVDNVCQNVLRVLTEADRLDVPVYKGCPKPIITTDGVTNGYHGENGFGDYAFEKSMDLSQLQTEYAVIKLIELSKTYEGELVMLALGPLTNIALALQIDPLFGKRLKSCFIMGGSYQGVGNALPHGEFNFSFDPVAAHLTLSELACPITLVCWEVCLDNIVSTDWRNNSLFDKESRCVRLLKAIEFKKHLKYYLFADQLAAGALLYPEMVTSVSEVPCSVVIEGQAKGLLMTDHRTKFGIQPASWPRVKIVKTINLNIFLERMQEDIHSLP